MTLIKEFIADTAIIPNTIMYLTCLKPRRSPLFTSLSLSLRTREHLAQHGMNQIYLTPEYDTSHSAICTSKKCHTLISAHSEVRAA